MLLLIHLFGSTWGSTINTVSIQESRGNYRWDATFKEALPTMNHYEYPQASACFIQHVDDTMESIMNLATSESRLFKYGSGSGSNLSKIRAKGGKAVRWRNSQWSAFVHGKSMIRSQARSAVVVKPVGLR